MRGVGEFIVTSGEQSPAMARGVSVREAIGRGAGWLWAVLIGLLAAAPAARAQTLDRPAERLIDDMLSTEINIAPEATQLRIGAGPVYTVLDSGPTTFHPVVPIISYRYREWIAVDENEARVNVIGADSTLGLDGFRIGPMMKIDFGRKRLDATDTEALGRVGTSLELGGFASYGYGPARLRIQLRQDVVGGHHGAVMEIDARTGLYQHGGVSVGFSLLATWASQRYMQTFYGVTPAESAETNLPVFTARPGFKDLSPTLIAEYKISSHWAAVGSVQYVYLLDAASDSPVPLSRGIAGRTNMGFFVIYTF